LTACSTSVSLGNPGTPPDNGANDANVIEVGAPPPDPTPSADYPAGPYGKKVGDVIPNFSWKGYRNGVGDYTDIALLDYYDPDGKKGVRALKLNIAAVW